MTQSVDPHEPCVIARVPSEAEAAALVTALSAEGIRATTTGGFTAGFIAEAPGDVQIVVARHDEKRARKLLSELRKGNAEVDWSQVDVGDPEDT
jgi:hypothetical protein